MYVYFLDKLAQEQPGKFSIPVFESEIVQHDIRGRIERLSTFKDPTIIIEDAIAAGQATTIIAVGEDATFFELLPFAIKHKLGIGFIPLQKQSRLSHIFGMPHGLAAVQLLAKRLTQTLDVLTIVSAEETHQSIFGITLPTSARVFIEDSWSVRVKDDSGATLCIENAATMETLSEKNPHINAFNDGLLDVVTKKTTTSMKRWFGSAESSTLDHFQARSVRVESASATMNAVGDNDARIALPCTITVTPKALHCIVGKESVLLSNPQ